MHWLLLITLAFDLAAAKSEPNLERRSDRALENAGTALTAAVMAYDHDDLDQTEMALQELKESVRSALPVARGFRQESPQQRAL